LASAIWGLFWRTRSVISQRYSEEAAAAPLGALLRHGLVLGGLNLDRGPCYAYDMAHRTTLVLDEPTRKAARELALRYDCSMSEAIRRAVLRHRDSVLGVPEKERETRTAALYRLFELFEGHDAEAEIRRLKAEDAGF